MMLKRRGLFGFLILSLAILSCNLQSSQGAQGFAATLAAIAATQTSQAAALATAASGSATVGPSATSSTPTASPTATASASATVSPSPTASVTLLPPAPHVPAAPDGLKLIASCLPVHLPGGPILYKYGVVVRWTDHADNESTYVVDYAFPLGFNGAAPDVIEVDRPANATSDSHEFEIYVPHVQIQVSVFARNAVGDSRAVGTFTCP